MSESLTINVFETLKDEIKVWGTVLDAGCGELKPPMMETLKDLFAFDSSDFNKTWGIDLNPPNLLQCHILYRNFMLKKHDMPYSDYTRDAEFIKRYDEKYLVEPADLRTWECRTEPIGLIVCDLVLHFFPDAEKIILIKKFMDCLQPEGMLFIRINSTTHPGITKANSVERLGDHIYKEREGERSLRTFYLTEPEFILPQIPEFEIISKYNDKENNLHNFTRLFRK